MPVVSRKCRGVCPDVESRLCSGVSYQVIVIVLSDGVVRKLTLSSIYVSIYSEKYSAVQAVETEKVNMMHLQR